VDGAHHGAPLVGQVLQRLHDLRHQCLSACGLLYQDLLILDTRDMNWLLIKAALRLASRPSRARARACSA
jgi:hypothetical protein